MLVYPYFYTLSVPHHLMQLLLKIKQYFSGLISAKKEMDPAAGYNLWADNYDAQPDNLMLALDEVVFTQLFNSIDITNKTVADVGCGTGRHWQKLSNANPFKLIGFDVSENMLAMLRQKFPKAETYLIQGHALPVLSNSSCDVVISTLTIAHIENAAAALTEWARVLKPGGSIIVTDYHPSALGKGARRTFSYNGKTVAVKNYIHPVNEIIALAKQLNLQVLRLIEKNIDDSMRHYYEKQNAVAVFEKWRDIPVIYALCLKKPDGTA
jgi:ubiquinone/menaquinone biosynthesis C-methylase UbiE